MKIKSLLLSGAVLIATQADAQSWVVDSVAMGPGYTNDVFYSLKNGAAKTEANTNWHLAFQMTPPGPYGNVSILANHVMGGVRVFPAHMAASANFASFDPADTSAIATPGNEVFNSDESWNFGAFNQMADMSNQFDYSWGTYDMATHNVNGDSLYLIKTGGNFYKVWIQTFVSTPADSVQWDFRIANVDGTNDTTIHLYRTSGYTDRLFAYYNVVTKTVTDREPSRAAWDMVFTRYKEYIPGAPGSPYYNVTGVLTNFKVTVQEINDMPADSVTLDTMNMVFTDNLKEIGSDWKQVDMSTTPPGWIIPDSLSYFIKTLNTNEYYQLMFTAFRGSSTGVAVFQKRLLSSIPTSVEGLAVTSSANFLLAPNPAVNSATIMVDAQEAAGATSVLVTDLAGRVVHRATVNMNKGINAYSLNVDGLATGTYIVSLSNSSWKAAQKLMVQH